MITPNELIAKASRLYPAMVKAQIEGNIDAMFPYSVPANLTPSSEISSAIQEVDRLRASSKQTTGFGYSIQWASRRSRSLGLNLFPNSILIESPDDLVQLIGKQGEWEALRRAIIKMQAHLPALGGWLAESTHWKKLLGITGSLDELLGVVEYFQTNPRPDCFARELPLAISTKLIEQNKPLLTQWLDRVLPPHQIDTRYGHSAFEPRYGLRYVRPHLMLRLLDSELQQELGLPTDEISMPAAALAKLPVDKVWVLIVENKINLLTLPRLRRTLALGGLGNAVTQLCEIEWLTGCELFYWGDFDVEGFQILSRLRESFPHVRSFLMDRATFDSTCEFAIQGNESMANVPVNLSSEESMLYEHLAKHRLRLEQERIPQSRVLQYFQDRFALPVQLHTCSALHPSHSLSDDSSLPSSRQAE